MRVMEKILSMVDRLFLGRDKLIHLYEKVQFINRVVKNKNVLYFKENGWMFNSIPKISDILGKRHLNF